MTYKLFYDEKSVAEQILKNGFTDGCYNRSEAAALVRFCEQHDQFFNYVRNRKEIKSIVKKSEYEFVRVETVHIRKKELETIQTVGSFKFQKILLAMLAIAKKTRKSYLSTDRWVDVKRIISRAITTQDIRNCIMYCYKNGLVSSGNDDYHKILFVDNDSEPVFTISNEKELYDLVKKYEKYVGGSFRYCTICGAKFVKQGKKHIYCEKHTKEKELERKRRWSR
jgi:hypothetical protein